MSLIRISQPQHIEAVSDMRKG